MRLYDAVQIYNSRNYIEAIARQRQRANLPIYNSRNYIEAIAIQTSSCYLFPSTIVEIILRLLPASRIIEAHTHLQ